MYFDVLCNNGGMARHSPTHIIDRNNKHTHTHTHTYTHTRNPPPHPHTHPHDEMHSYYPFRSHSSDLGQWGKCGKSLCGPLRTSCLHRLQSDSFYSVFLTAFQLITVTHLPSALNLLPLSLSFSLSHLPPVETLQLHSEKFISRK